MDVCKMLYAFYRFGVLLQQFADYMLGVLMTKVPVNRVKRIEDLAGYHKEVIAEFVVALEQLLKLEPGRPSVARAWELLMQVRGPEEIEPNSGWRPVSQRGKIVLLMSINPVVTRSYLKTVSQAYDQSALAATMSYIRAGKRGRKMNIKYRRKTKCFYNLDTAIGKKLFDRIA